MLENLKAKVSTLQAKAFMQLLRELLRSVTTYLLIYLL